MSGTSEKAESQDCNSTMGSKGDLSILFGKSWDVWTPERGPSQPPDSRREVRTLHDHSIVELGTLPKTLMPLFGSYPVDDVFSLVTCPTCKFRFRTQTADHHLRKCQKKKTRESKSASSHVEKVVKVPSVVIKTKPAASTTTSKNDLMNNNVTERVSTPSPKVASPNLVPPIVIKIEHANDAATEPTYTTQSVKPIAEGGPEVGNFNSLPDYFPQPLVQNVEKPLRQVQEIVVPKKVQEVREKKLIPLKDRRFNPDEHCGVPIDPDGRPCTRSLTCKTHSMSLKRSVTSRTSAFDLLLAAYKKSRDKAKAVENGCIAGVVSPEFVHVQPDPFEAMPTPSPATISRTSSVTRKEPTQIESTGNLEVMEYQSQNFDRYDTRYLASVNTRSPLTSLKIDSQLGREQKVLSFGNPLSNALIFGHNGYTNLFANQYQTEDFKPEFVSPDDIDDYYKGLPLEVVKVPRPLQKSSRKKEKRATRDALELFRKGELSQLELLEQGILMSKSPHTPETDRSPKKMIPNLKRKHSSPGESPVDSNKIAKQLALAQHMLNTSNRSPISFKLSPSPKANQSSLLQQGLNMALSNSLRKTSGSPTLSGNVQGIGVKQLLSYRNPLLVQPQPNSKYVSNLIERIPTALRLPIGRNENHSTTHPEAIQVVKSRVARNLNLNKSETHSSGAPRPAWTKHNTKELSAGQRSPHDGPVSDSELKKLLDSQFEDLDP